jgi:hypothetical protein
MTVKDYSRIDVFVCTRECYYADHEFEIGALVSGEHPIIIRQPGCFKKLPESDERVSGLRDRLQLRAEQMDELARMDARQRQSQARGQERPDQSAGRADVLA